MLTKEQRIERLKIGSYTPQHAVLLATVLDKVGKELYKRAMGYLDDENWLHHIIVPDGVGKWISVYCGGFDKRIDVQYLRKNGDVDKRYIEKSFLTPKGAVNYLVKMITKHGRL